MEVNVNGSKAWFYSGGRELNRARPTVTFIHGAAMDHTVWILPSRYFVRKGYNVLAVDLAGHGRSDGPLSDSIESMADWVADVVAAAGLESTAVVGHSMGSLVALEVAARHRTMARSLTMVATAAPMAVTDLLLDAARNNSHDALDMLTIWGYSKRSQLGGNETPGMWMVGGTLKLLERAAPGVLFNDLNACNAYLGGVDSASKVDCPVLIVCGEMDMMTPPKRARDLIAGFSQARTVTLKGCGHSILSERPDAFLDALVSNV